MQASSDCFHAKQINNNFTKNLNKQFSEHIESCPDCLKKIKTIQQQKKAVLIHLDSYKATKEISPDLRRELREAVELAHPKKVKVVKKEMKSLGRKLSLMNKEMFFEILRPKNLAMLTFAIFFYLATSALVNK